MIIYDHWVSRCGQIESIQFDFSSLKWSSIPMSSASSRLAVLHLAAFPRVEAASRSAHCVSKWRKHCKLRLPLQHLRHHTTVRTLRMCYVCYVYTFWINLGAILTVQTFSMSSTTAFCFSLPSAHLWEVRPLGWQWRCYHQAWHSKDIQNYQNRITECMEFSIKNCKLMKSSIMYTSIAS